MQGTIILAQSTEHLKIGSSGIREFLLDPLPDWILGSVVKVLEVVCKMLKFVIDEFLASNCEG